MTSLSELLVVLASCRIVHAGDARHVVEGILEPAITSAAHLDASRLAAGLGHGSETSLGSEGVVVSVTDGPIGLSEHRGDGDLTDFWPGAKDVDVTMLAAFGVGVGRSGHLLEDALGPAVDHLELSMDHLQAWH